MISKAYLFSSPDKKYEISKNHKATSSRINRESKLGNIPKEYIDVFNKFGKLRDTTRYLNGNIEFSNKEAIEYLNSTKEYLVTVENRANNDN